MNEKFETVKSEILKRAKNKNACQGAYREALKASNDVELLEVVKNNLLWCCNNGVIDHDLVKLFDQNAFLSSGLANNGENNVGWSNTGDRNTGDWNTGDWNTGYNNTGDRNTGSWNTGSWNTGDRNTGDRNTGYSNTGDRNTGSWNTGDRNTGYSNTGDRNTGAFCTGEKYIKLFNKESDWTEKDFLQSEAYHLLCQVDTKMWIPEESMSDEEKEKHFGYKKIGGFYRDVPFKQAFTDRWHNWDDRRRSVFTSLPNFDAEIFEHITGVRV